jgi:hypothetical protein
VSAGYMYSCGCDKWGNSRKVRKFRIEAGPAAEWGRGKHALARRTGGKDGRSYCRPTRNDAVPRSYIYTEWSCIKTGNTR